MKHKFLFLILTLFSLSQFISAQYYETGQDPASLKWLQIKTGRFTVIYPAKYGPGGIEYARSLDKAFTQLGSLFPQNKFRLPVVIHNFTIQSNGYVAWAPKRMELYPTPEQNTIPLAPEKQLAIHELTHVLQMESLDQGFSKWMTVLFGQQFTGAVASLLPSWFLEGDAVFAESALSESGRGRTPAFQKELKALIVDNNKNYNYDKILNGSYKDYVPDDYQTGFQMVTFALAKGDPKIWNKVLKFTAEQPFTLNPVNISLTRSSGLRKKTLWNETSDSLKTIWKNDVSKNKTSGYESINPDKKGEYINYYSPVYVSEDSVIAVKTSLFDPASFVLINPKLKTEKRILTPGSIYPWFISYGSGKLVWVETISDSRWENREYSVIKLMDLKNNSVRRLSQKSRYVSAAISPDGNSVAAVENTSANINNLVLLNARTGAIIESFPTSGNGYLQHPQWEQSGKKITFIFLAEGGEGVISFDIKDRKWETLIDASSNDLQSSFLRNDSLFYVTSQSGTDNIYLMTRDKKITRITHSRFGVIDASPYGNKIIFGNYTVRGHEICSTVISGNEDVRNETSPSTFLINRFNIKHIDDTINDRKVYNPTPYRKWEHLFRFHSWMPFYVDVAELNADPTSVRPGITLLTQNSLGTLTSTLGYEYSEENRNVIHSRVTWSGWYPVIESQLDYGMLPHIYKMGANVSTPAEVDPGISFVNTISLPLQFNTGKFYQFLRPSVSSDYVNHYIFLSDKETYDYGQTIITGRLYFSNYFVSAQRDIYPRWGQVVDFNYCFAPFDREIYGSAISLQTTFYFPGFFANHGIKIRLQAEKQETEKYLYSNFSSIPRGYHDIVAKEINFFSADYFMPIAYPDFNVGSLLYVKRIRSSFFFDYAEGPGNSLYTNSSKGLIPIYNTAENEALKSYGIELMADFHILRIPYMISGGIQSAWKNLHDPPTIGFLFNINLYGMTFGKKQL
jgi:hypothetical protein